MLDCMLGGRSEYPELWMFLEALRNGERLSGTVAAIERFGVFVALDDGPAHPAFPGVGFITQPELSWRRFDNASDVVHVGQHLSCSFLQFDTTNLEARLSLRATQPDPFQAFADGAALGQELIGRVTKLVPIGAFVQVADGVDGLVPTRDLTLSYANAFGDAVQVNDKLAVVVTDLDRQRRRLLLGLR
jgi:ribosomal protein S1